MNALKNLSIAWKILSALAVVIALFFAAMLVDTYFLGRVHNNLDSIVSREAEAIKLSARVNRNLNEILVAERNMLLADSQGASAGFAARIDQIKLSVNSRAERLESMRLLPEDQSVLDAGLREYRTYLSLLGQVTSLASSGRTEDAVALSSVEAREHADLAERQLAAFVDRMELRLEEAKERSNRSYFAAITVTILLFAFALLLSIAVTLLTSRAIAAGLSRLMIVADAIANGDLDSTVDVTSSDEVGKLGHAISRMQAGLRKARDDAEAQNWIKTGLNRLNDVMLGDQPAADLAGNVINEVAAYVGAEVGTFCAVEQASGTPSLALLAGYACTPNPDLPVRFEPGERLVGQAVLEKRQILITDIPDDYIKVASTLGDTRPRHICITPLLFEGQVKGAIELGTLDGLTESQTAYLSQASPSVAIAIETSHNRDRLRAALEESQRLTEETQTTNEELEEQTQALQQSDERLRAQQEEMETTNEELEEKNDLLEKQKREVEQARRQISDKAEQLALTSKYKSEFLANMSHELRTPLNSLLLLARGLEENREGNLSSDQVESARIISRGGNDLLTLINEILDLAKIESGRMIIKSADVDVADLADSLRSMFEPLAGEKHLKFQVLLEDDCPDRILSDRTRMQQVVRNLVSNAIKFTSEGSVAIEFGRLPTGTTLSQRGLSPENTLAIRVRDTGVGIAADKQAIIFQPFEQAEAGTTRQFGGTGLGLSISREIVNLLGGEILVTSEVGHGSTFTVCLPVHPAADRTPAIKHPAQSRSATEASAGQEAENQTQEFEKITDDRNDLVPGDKVIAVIEDDEGFASVLLKSCRERGFKCIVSPSGEVGLEMVRTHKPAAVILDLRLPGMGGQKVLHLLKDSPETRHIPVHIASVDEPSKEILKQGVIGHLIKPVSREDLAGVFEQIETLLTRKAKNLLVVEDDTEVRKSVVAMVVDSDVEVTEAKSGEEARAALKARRYDCMVLDLGLKDMDGMELLESASTDPDILLPPVIVHTARDLTVEQETALRAYAESIVLKDVRSQERLLDEVSLFLHRVVKDMPEEKRKIITDLHDSDVIFSNKTVLIVDDDMRTVFALSKLLRDRGMKTIKADNGQKALEALAAAPEVDIVLMDIMMPVLDGYDAIKRMREQEALKKTPVIALTAKAMKGDAERCIAAGANDYLPKPVDQDRLLSMMRIWLYR